MINLSLTPEDAAAITASAMLANKKTDDEIIDCLMSNCGFSNEDANAGYQRAIAGKEHEENSSEQNQEEAPTKNSTEELPEDTSESEGDQQEEVSKSLADAEFAPQEPGKGEITEPTDEVNSNELQNASQETVGCTEPKLTASDDAKRALMKVLDKAKRFNRLQRVLDAKRKSK